MHPLISRPLQYLRTLATNPYFWGGLGGLVLLGALGYVLLNSWIMPSYTRHDVAVTVPEVLNLSYEDAVARLEAVDLGVARDEGRFNPNVEPNVVVDQNPPPQTSVKPGRTIYLTINTGTPPMVQVPSVAGLSIREARNSMTKHGLQVVAERPDPIPDPHPNTVTRQNPAPGASVPQGTEVTLWYSTGLGDRYTTMPDLNGMTAREAQALLLAEHRLRSVIIGEANEPVTGQSQQPGTRIREGFEIRLFTGAQQ